MDFSECSVFASHLLYVSPVYLASIEWCEKDSSLPTQILGRRKRDKLARTALNGEVCECRKMRKIKKCEK